MGEKSKEKLSPTDACIIPWTPSTIERHTLQSKVKTTDSRRGHGRASYAGHTKAKTSMKTQLPSNSSDERLGSLSEAFRDLPRSLTEGSTSEQDETKNSTSSTHKTRAKGSKKKTHLGSTRTAVTTPSMAELQRPSSSTATITSTGRARARDADAEQRTGPASRRSVEAYVALALVLTKSDLESL